MLKTRRFIAAFLILIMIFSFSVSVFAGAESVDDYGRRVYSVNGTYYPVALKNFKRVHEYKSGTFTDVPENAWYANSVKTVYELGLMMGDGNGHFNPDGNVTLAETYALASRISSIYKTGKAEFIQGSPWYQVYYDYVDEHDYYATLQDDPGSYANRDAFAHILGATIPERHYSYTEYYHVYDKSEWPAINEILYSDIKDIDDGRYESDLTLRLYKAGILTGSDANGSFKPNTTITRAEAAAIIERIAFPELRKSFTPATHTPISLEFYEGNASVFPTLESITGLPLSETETKYFEEELGRTVRTMYIHNNATIADWEDYKSFMLDYADKVSGKGGFMTNEYVDFIFMTGPNSMREVTGEWDKVTESITVSWDYFEYY